MAEAVTFPSPSVILDQTPPKPTPLVTSKPAVKNARRSNSAEAKKKAQRKDSGHVNCTDGNVAKPKQSKSRNGTESTQNLAARQNRDADGIYLQAVRRAKRNG